MTSPPNLPIETFMRPTLFACLTLSLFCFTSTSDAEEPKSDALITSGLKTRTHWTTSNFRGRPEPPLPYRAQRVFPKLRFDHPTLLTNAPGTDRLFVSDLTPDAAKLFSFPNDQACAKADLFLDMNALVSRLKEKTGDNLALVSIYGMAFHPQFVENRYCYLCYVVRDRNAKRTEQHPNGTRVVRLTVSKSDPPECDPESEVEVISWIQGGHNGGCLKFGPEGYLYISTGDAGSAFPPDGLNSGQDITNLRSAILRIDVDHPQGKLPYTIPSDNPFVSMKDARGEIWAYGLRNPWKMSFDRKRGDLWVGDVGWELWEMVYHVERGGNYGWSLVEGRQPVHAERRRGPTPILPPTVEIPHTEGASITGGFVYRGKKFPQLYGSYIFGDWETRRVWAVPVDGEELGERREIVEPTVRLSAFAEDNQGELYLVDHDDGTIHMLAPNNVETNPEKFPRKLSETGLFSSVEEHKTAPGVVAFSINSEQWTDHATAERFVAVPGEASIGLRAAPKQVVGSMFSRTMEFPIDAVLVKTLSMDMEQGNPTTRRRIETQVLHFDGREWRGYTYAWNETQTDAALVQSGGSSRTLHIKDSTAPGGNRVQHWRYPSRMECIRCHNPWAQSTLAFNVPQINRDHDYAGITANQIHTLRHIGLLDNVIEQPDPENPYDEVEPHLPADLLPRLVNPHDESASVDLRARAYLHANCAHCHRFNGGGSAKLYLPYDTTLAKTESIAVRPALGTFGIHDAEILAPGDPYRSVLYYRMAKVGPGHMPYIGTKIVDRRGVALVHDWIRQLPVRLKEEALIEQLVALDEPTVLAEEKKSELFEQWKIALQAAKAENREKPNKADLIEAAAQIKSQAADRAQKRNANRIRLIGELLASPSRAMLLARATEKDQVPASIRPLVLDAAINHTSIGIRDLFEPFVPEELRSQRLGESIQPAEILKLSGDIARGRQLFHTTQTVQCRNCHRIGKDGKEIGPNLSEIGKKNDRAKILESILDPSKNIDPKYITWLVETDSGKVLTGLLVKKDTQEVVLRDAQNNEHRLATDQIEEMFPQRTSLMPDLLLRDFTAEQVADLLAYLASLK